MRWIAIITVAGAIAGLTLSGCAPRTATIQLESHALTNAAFGQEGQPDVSLHQDACALLAARPHWREALRLGYQQWQIEPWYILAFIHQESRFNPTALSASNAYGLPQAKDGTWQWYQQQRGRPAASRERFDDAVDFIAWYAHKNVARNHVDLNDVRNQYLAYHEGLGGYESASFIGKPWLLNIAAKVTEQAATYQAQLQQCPVL